MTTNKEDSFLPPTQGRIEKKLGSGLFQVKCDNNGEIITAYIASCFRTAQGKRRAKLVEGSRVVVKITLRDLKKGQIISLIEKQQLKN